MRGVEEIAGLIGAEYVVEGTEKDAIDGLVPPWVVRPGTVEEVSAVLKLASGNGLAVTPRGGGTTLGQGNPPARLDLVLDLTRLDRIVEHAQGDLVVLVDAGARIEQVQQTLAGAGQMLALDGIPSGATIGGLIAANSNGPRRYRYGTVRDLLIGVTVVLSDGTVAKSGGKVVKNVAGYDLGKLMSGSLGTLAVVVGAVFRLHPRPTHRRLVQAALNDPAELTPAVQSILHSSIVPSALQCQWPADDSCRIQVLLEGVAPSVEAQSAMAAKLLRRHGNVIEGGGDEEAFDLVDATPPPPDEVLIRVSTLPNRLSEIAGAIRVASRHVPSGALISGSVGNGILDVRVGADDPTGVAAIVEELRAIGGESHVVVRNAPTTVKRLVDVWGPVGDSLEVMRNVKQRFDPTNTLNPGRFAGGI